MKLFVVLKLFTFNDFIQTFEKPFFGHFMVNWRNPLSEDEKKNWTEFSVLSKSGATLSGLYAIANNPKATIVLGHPMGKEAKGYFLKNGYTDLLLSNGYNVVIFDINGFGESSMGNFSYYEDIVSISKKAKELFPNLQIDIMESLWEDNMPLYRLRIICIVMTLQS